MTLLNKVKVMTSSSLISGLISFLTLSVSGLYLSPNNFGIFALFSSIITVYSALSSLRFDTFICQTKTKSLAKHHAIIGFVLTLIFSFLFFLLSSLFYRQVHDIVEVNWFNIYISITILLIGFNQVSISWVLFNGNYELLSKVRVAQALIGSLVQLTLIIYFDFKVLALVAGLAISQGVGTFSLLLRSKFDLSGVKIEKIWRIFLAFKRRSLLSTLSYMVAIISPMLPAVIISKGVGSYEAGLFYFAYQIASTPFSFLRRIFSYLAMGEFDCNKPNFLIIFNKFKDKIKYIRLFFVFFLLSSYFSNDIFSIVFGDVWAESGTIFSIFFVVFLFDVAFYSAYQILNLRNEQKCLLFIETSRAILVLFGFVVVNYGFWYFILWYAFIMILFDIFTVLVLNKKERLLA